MVEDAASKPVVSPQLKVRRKNLDSVLRIEVTAHCQLCNGSGLQVKNKYAHGDNCIKVIVRVCPCVKLVID